MRHPSAPLALLIAGLTWADPAEAICSPPVLAATFSEAGYVYIDMGAGVTPAGVVGAFYACGNPAANSGGYSPSDWLFVDLGGMLSMVANLGDARVSDCPEGTLVTRLQTTSTSPIRFLTMAVLKGVAGTSVQYDYSYQRSPGEVLVAVPLPRPRIVSVTRLPGGVIQLGILFDPVEAGNTSGTPCGAVTGYELVGAWGTADPGRDPASWEVLTSVADDGSGATVTVELSCGEEDRFLATRLRFADGQKSDVVSRSTRLACSPILAEPRYRVVPKPAPGSKRPR